CVLPPPSIGSGFAPGGAGTCIPPEPPFHGPNRGAPGGPPAGVGIGAPGDVVAAPAVPCACGSTAAFNASGTPATTWPPRKSSRALRNDLPAGRAGAGTPAAGVPR